jgi:hypothetical protein
MAKDVKPGHDRMSNRVDRHPKPFAAAGRPDLSDPHSSRTSAPRVVLLLVVQLESSAV